VQKTLLHITLSSLTESFVRKETRRKVFNAFRDLKGFNYRDYGVEFGPIIKLIGIKIYFCLYILQGVGYGVDDRTLVAEGAMYLLILLQALSLLLKQYLDLFASHPEAIVEQTLQ
jgi:hypothetical protein